MTTATHVLVHTVASNLQDCDSVTELTTAAHHCIDQHHKATDTNSPQLSSSRT